MKFRNFYRFILVVGLFFGLVLVMKDSLTEKLKADLTSDFDFGVDFYDSDGGFDFLVKGGGNKKNGRYVEDRCADKVVPGIGMTSSLIEVVCFNKNCYEILVPSMGDYYCQDGVFVESKSVVNVVESDDGDNIFEKGMNLRDGQIVDGTADYCESEKSVMEYSFGVNLVLQCPEGTVCKDGACEGAEVSCKELIANSNRPEEKKFNFVFVGSDYHLIDRKNHKKGLDAFLWDVKTILGENSNIGFFDYEPFKSNREKFNLWYIDRFNEMPLVIEPYDYDAHEKRNSEGVKDARSLADKCKFDYDLENVMMVHLVANKGTLDSAINIATMREVQLFDKNTYSKCQKVIKKDLSLLAQYDKKGCSEGFSGITEMPLIDFNGDYRIAEYPDNLVFDRLVDLSSYMNLCKSQRGFSSTIENICSNGIDNLGRVVNHGSTLVHEFGHHFQFFDSSLPSASTDLDWAGVTIGNCFVTDSKTSCLANAPWKFLIGNACGKNGVLDCKHDDSLYDLEIGCFDGCIYEVKSFRPERASTYTYGLAVPEDSNGLGWDQLGLWEQWYLDRVMKAYLEL